MVEDKKRPVLGRCQHFFWVGVFLDVVGTAVLGMGIFCKVYYYDFLLYLGAIIIFLSLLCWFFWYTGNIEVEPADVFESRGGVLSNSLVHALSESVSHRFSFIFHSFSTTLMRLQQPRRSGLSRRRRQRDSQKQPEDTVTNPDSEGHACMPEASGIQDRVRGPAPSKNLETVCISQSDTECGQIGTRSTRTTQFQSLLYESIYPFLAHTRSYSLRGSISLPLLPLVSTDFPVIATMPKSRSQSVMACYSQIGGFLDSTTTLRPHLSNPSLFTRHSLLFMTSQDHGQDSLGLQSQLQRSTYAQASQSHAVSSKYSVLRFQSSFHSRSLAHVPEPVQDLQHHAIYSHNCVRRKTSVQEVSLSSYSSIRPFEKSDDQLSKNSPSTSQDLSGKENSSSPSSVSGTEVHPPVPFKSETVLSSNTSEKKYVSL